MVTKLSDTEFVSDTPLDAHPVWPNREKLCELAKAALEDLGGRASRSDLKTRAIELGEFSDEQRAVPGPPTKTAMTRLEYELGWAIDALHKEGVINNPARGTWELA